MNKQTKVALTVSIFSILMVPMQIASADSSYGDSNGIKKVKITNISNAVLTPPVVALCKKRMRPIARVGKPASVELESLAEGGDTTGLTILFEDNGCHVGMSETPVLPGNTVTVEVAGRRNHYLHIASMLLPTNDAFIYTSGKKVKNVIRRGGIALKSYDAGTEFNDELCAHIPGPLSCGGGEPFNADREEHNFVKPHPGLQGVGGVSVETYNWGEPVARVRISN